jgi:copper(I)-binding protein
MLFWRKVIAEVWNAPQEGIAVKALMATKANHAGKTKAGRVKDAVLPAHPPGQDTNGTIMGLTNRRPGYGITDV